MVEPVAFSYNKETAVNNYFQQYENPGDASIQANALAEFKGMVDTLRSKNIDVIVVQDTIEPHTPDSIFPNNWITCHQDGRVVLYPMYAQNRRTERRSDILQLIAEKYHISEVVDYTDYENQRQFLEGTGSMVLDHKNSVAYATLSERTDKTLFLQYCKDFDYYPVYFIASQTVNNKRLPIYHTNVMMCVANSYAVVCLQTIDNITQRNAVVESLSKCSKEIIEITEQQMQQFAGNMLQVENKEGKSFLVLSQTAFKALTDDQVKRISLYNELLPIAVPTIEKYGGGSVRCMLAEIFNERTSE